MYNKRLIEAFGVLLLPKLDRLEDKCDRIISDLSELRTSLCHPDRNIDALIDKLEESADEMLRQSQTYRHNIEEQADSTTSLFTLKITKDDGHK